jgi:hypothetical protein
MHIIITILLKGANMIFKKKNAGSLIEKRYIWTANARKHKIILHYEGDLYKYWFNVEREGRIIYNSKEDDIQYDSFDEATKNIETWVELNIKPRKTKFTIPQKYLVIVNTLKKIAKENPDSPVAKEITNLLKEIREI